APGELRQIPVVGRLLELPCLSGALALRVLVEGVDANLPLRDGIALLSTELREIARFGVGGLGRSGLETRAFRRPDVPRAVGAALLVQVLPVGGAGRRQLSAGGGLPGAARCAARCSAVWQLFSFGCD